MTTAHRPTWKAAVAQGSEGGWSAGGAVSHLRSALDAPAHTRLKVRHYEIDRHSAEDADTAEDKNRKQLKSRLVQQSLAAILEAETKVSVQERIGKRQMDPAIEERAKIKLLKNTAEIDIERIKAKYDDDDDEDIVDDDDDHSKNNGIEESDLDDDDEESDDEEEDDEDDEAALQAELAKIRAEREASKRKAQVEENMQKEEAAAVLGNPLLSLNKPGESSSSHHTPTASGKLKRRWNDDVVFRNQANGTTTTTTTGIIKKRFINDTVRNDFHKRFLNKFIR